MAESDAGTGPWTVARLLAWTREHFERQAVESPRLCAEILLAHALQCERIQLYTRYETAPEADALAAFRGLVKKAATGWPIAYLTGRKEFFSLSFEVTPDVLIPRPETEVLVERTLSLLRQPTSDDGRSSDQTAEPRGRARAASPAVLDLGAGSGCIIVSLARHLPDARLFASDSSEAALVVARRNAARLGVADRVEFRCGDWLAAWPGMRFDVIVSNPPYIARSAAGSLPANVRDHEPHAALFSGDDGLAAIRRLIAEAPAHLSTGGRLLLEIGFDQSADVQRLLRDAGWSDIAGYRDTQGHERVLHARPRATAQALSA